MTDRQLEPGERAHFGVGERYRLTRSNDGEGYMMVVEFGVGRRTCRFILEPGEIRKMAELAGFEVTDP